MSLKLTTSGASDPWRAVGYGEAHVARRMLAGLVLSAGLLVAAVWPSGLNDNGDYVHHELSSLCDLDCGEDVDGDGRLDPGEDAAIW